MKKLTGAVLLVGSPQNMPDIRYATGFTAPDPVVFLQEGRKKHLVVSLLELERARRVTKNVTIWAAEALKIRGKFNRTLSGWTSGLLRQLEIRAVVVPPEFPIAVAEKLRQSGIRVRVSESTLFPQRQIKTDEELARIAECQRAAVQAMLAAVRHLALAHVDGKGFLRVDMNLVTSETIRALINKVLLDHHCMGQGTIVAGGPQAADPHEVGFGPLRYGESIVIDIFPQHLDHGYWGDLTRTVVKGAPSAALQKIYHAVKAAHAAALSMVKAGVTASRVHEAAVSVIRRRGFQNSVTDGKTQGFIHSTGHGVGLNIHEMPRVGLRSARLKTGNVITVEPGLYYREIGSVRIEDLIVVTPTGWKPLAVCEHFFQV
ncbi:MAG: Xaa-Pro peptidase family protein [Verrucomicrobia bacterium]|nr:Xaa-Pro peptidase family protein [Verrucomicrobiota bacterium]MCG2680836.1 Xaa-Pro peptidase family protein [Kiritimatiellia bacterium]MBU4246846.1 Xaa-Pro peptidase family protein [Verrucomicrobiota bacterium]MBU4290408.1 Xaa-Pro peptidase family protein [Verrucomicrobiota bacterium]MBU4430259.1 Xaa-Pro peptidase family protein [Verrucomicrobiota bacterium]